MLLHAEEGTTDLHGSSHHYAAQETTTEYEDKFVAKGKNINYVKVVVDKTLVEKEK